MIDEPTRDMQDLIEVVGTMIEQGICEGWSWDDTAKALNEPAWRVHLATEVWAETHVHKKPHADPIAFFGEPEKNERYFVAHCPQCKLETPMWHMSRDGLIEKGRCLRCGREAPLPREQG